MADVLALLNAFIADPKNPKVYVTLLTDKGFSINVEVTELGRRNVEKSIQKFRDFQKARIGADIHKEEGVRERRSTLQDIVHIEKRNLMLEPPKLPETSEIPTMWTVLLI